jgi:hypothetical protein
MKHSRRRVQYLKVYRQQLRKETLAMGYGKPREYRAMN